MANTAIHGRVIDEQGAGIAGLTVRAIDFDPFFKEDDVLGAGKTEGDGTFLISYSTDAYRAWKADRNPDLVVQVLGPPHTEPKLFGTRLLHETPEAEDVTDSTHEVGTITIHRNNPITYPRIEACGAEGKTVSRFDLKTEVVRPRNFRF